MSPLPHTQVAGNAERQLRHTARSVITSRRLPQPRDLDLVATEAEDHHWRTQRWFRRLVEQSRTCDL